MIVESAELNKRRETRKVLVRLLLCTGAYDPTQDTSPFPTSRLLHLDWKATV